jgi:hypothetical protein
MATIECYREDEQIVALSLEMLTKLGPNFPNGDALHGYSASPDEKWVVIVFSVLEIHRASPAVTSAGLFLLGSLARSSSDNATWLSSCDRLLPLLLYVWDCGMTDFLSRDTVRWSLVLLIAVLEFQSKVERPSVVENPAVLQALSVVWIQYVHEWQIIVEICRVVRKTGFFSALGSDRATHCLWLLPMLSSLNASLVRYCTDATASEELLLTCWKFVSISREASAAVSSAMHKSLGFAWGLWRRSDSHLELLALLS